MGCDVYANNDEIACKAGDGKVIASFPDVCLSPPSPPAGPVPVPYPNTSFSKDMKNGSKTVKIKGKEVMLKDKSFYKTSPLGDEAATKSFGAGVITHVITGKTYFVAWSTDVKFEGQNVDRHTDLTTSNHASPMADVNVPNPNGSGTATAKPPPDAECPCCHEKPPHANQWDPDTGDMYEEVDELEYYKKGVEHRQNEVAPASVAAFEAATKGKISEVIQADYIAKAEALRQKSEDALKTLEDANPLCPNLHTPGDPCGKHLNKTNPEPKTSDKSVRSQLGFSDGVRNECLRRYPNKPDGTPIPKVDENGKGPEVCHKTPLSLGGCPKDQKNLIPKDALTEECKDVDTAQTTLQSDIGAANKRARS